MNERTCGNCRWWRYDLEFSIDGFPLGQCRRDSPIQSLEWPQVSSNDFCGEWADKSITPEQEERRELVRQFAMAIVQGVISHPTLKATQPIIWKMAEELADAEPRGDK